MATGRDVQLTRQIGEYLAAAELGRRGWIATTFTGSLPGFDILAVNPDGRVLEVQIKAIRSASWQLNAGQFLDIEIRDGAQFGSPHDSVCRPGVRIRRGQGAKRISRFRHNWSCVA